MEDGEKNNCLCVSDGEGLVLESFCFDVSVVVDLLDSVDIGNDAEICFKKDFVVTESLAIGLKVEMNLEQEVFLVNKML